VRLPKIVLSATLLIVLPLVVTASCLFYIPSQSLNFLARHVLNSQELNVTNIQQAALSLTGLHIASLDLQAGNYTSSLAGLSVSYDLLSLFSGKFHTVTIEQLKVSVDVNSGSAQPEPSSPNDPAANFDSIIALLTNPPLDELAVLQLKAVLATEEVNGSFRLSSSPAAIAGQFNLLSQPALDFSISSSISTSEPLVLSAELSKDGNPVLQTQATLAARLDSLDVDAVSQVDVQEFIALGQKFDLLPGLSSTTSKLQLSSTLTIENLFTAPEFNNIKVTLSSLDDAAQLVFENQTMSVGVGVGAALPVRIQSTSSDPQDWFTIEMQPLNFVLTGVINELEFNTQLSTSIVRTNCQQSFRCKVSTVVSATSQGIKAPTWSVDELRATGPVVISFSGTDVDLAGTDLRLTVTNGGFSETTTSFAATVNQWQVQTMESELITAQAQFELGDWSLSYGVYALNKPVARGNFSLINNELKASVEGSLNTDLKVNSQISAKLIDSSGSATFSLPALTLNQGRTLSSYLLGVTPEIDIVAGGLSAAGSLDWRFDSNDSLWIFGPLRFDAVDVSGAYDDSYFLGLSTTLTAEFANPLGLRTTKVQTARIGTAELGLAISDISWGYEFDSTDSTMAIYDLTGNLLGGNVTIPQAKFQNFSSDTQLTVVISDLDLAQITALAEYPELQVQGFVSGYLPVILSNGEITMQEGLVSALNQGGSIRYNPLNPSTNTSIKLVNDALSNYQFKSLDSELFYDELGDLNMQVKLRGGNPDMAGGQQINLNLGIVNNVPKMLESLRASRSISDALERTLQRRQ
jgi:hypothetical protein